MSLFTIILSLFHSSTFRRKSITFQREIPSIPAVKQQQIITYFWTMSLTKTIMLQLTNLFYAKTQVILQKKNMMTA